MRRTVAALAATTLLLTGCAGQSPGTGQPGEPAKPTSIPVVVTYTVTSGASGDSGFKVQFTGDDGRVDEDWVAGVPVWTRRVTLNAVNNPQVSLVATADGPFYDTSLRCVVTANGVELVNEVGRPHCTALASLSKATAAPTARPTTAAPPVTTRPAPKPTTKAPPPKPRPKVCRYATDQEITALVARELPSAQVLNAMEYTGGCGYMFSSMLSDLVNVQVFPNARVPTTKDSVAVPGLGGTAYWHSGRTLDVQRGNKVVRIYVSLPRDADHKRIAVDVYKLIRARV